MKRFGIQWPMPNPPLTYVASGPPPSSLSAAEPVAAGAVEADVVADVAETLPANVFDSPVVTGVQPGRKHHGQASAGVKVSSPSQPAAGSVQLASGSPIQPEFFGEVSGGPGSTTLVTAAVTGGAPATSTGSAPPPAVAQLPTDGVGLEKGQLFETNEEFYGEDLGGVGHGGGAEEGEMAEEAREEQLGADEEEDEEEREKQLHVVEPVELATTDTDVVAK